MPIDLEELVERLEDRLPWISDAEPQEPHGLAIEEGDSEDDAPVLERARLIRCECCTAVLGHLAPGVEVPGVRVLVRVEVRDNESGDESSGLRRARLHVAKPNNGGGLQILGNLTGDQLVWIPSREESRQSRSRKVSRDFSVCIPCSAINKEREFLLVLTQWDHAGNVSTQFIQLRVPGDHYERCCAGAPYELPPMGREPEDQSDRPHGEPEDCPCFVRVYYVPVSTWWLTLVADFELENPRDYDWYHSALEVQYRDGDGVCRRFVLEMQSPSSSSPTVGQLTTRPVKGSDEEDKLDLDYSLWKVEDGKVEDEETALWTILVSRDCAKARRIVELFEKVPLDPYNSFDEGRDPKRWTSNSFVYWLLKEAGVNARRIPGPPDGGRTPGWPRGRRVS